MCKIAFLRLLLAGAVASVARPTALRPRRELPQAGTVQAVVDCGDVVNVMRGGIGASWHAMETPIPIGHCGSGWGGYPPAEDERAWRQIYRHAEWLGLDWNRVEIEQRIYEPERGKFTFDSPGDADSLPHPQLVEKRAGTCSCSKCGAMPPGSPIPSSATTPPSASTAHRSIWTPLPTAWRRSIEHLVKHRRYTCIKWLCINNEPFGLVAGAAASAAFAEVGAGCRPPRMDKRGLRLPLSGPDISPTGFPARRAGGLRLSRPARGL